MSRMTKRVAPKTHGGGVASTDLTSEQKLRRSVMSCMLWENMFYEDGVSIADRIKSLIPEVEPEKVAQIAREARLSMKLRHIPLFITRQMARLENHKPYVSDVLSAVIQRADELAEFLALYMEGGRQPISAQVKKGLARAFTKFDEYQLAKYNRKGEYSLLDVMRICHPTPANEEQAALWRRLRDDQLSSPGTWEERLSAGENKKIVFESLLAENRLGPLALLRNLRLMTNEGVSKDMIKNGLLKMRTEKVLPFRFFSAYNYAPQFKTELETAMFRCLTNHEKMMGKTVLLVDVSGSMSGRLSAKSEMSCMDAATALAVLLREICEDVSVYTFSDNLVHVGNSRGFKLQNDIVRSQRHNGTYLGRSLSQMKEEYDRIIIFTDEQVMDRIAAPRGAGYIVNVANYRNGIGYGEWVHVDGFSEAIIDFIIEYEKEFVKKQIENGVSHLELR